MAYENLFIRLDIFMKNDKENAIYEKRLIFSLCHLNLFKLNRFIKENSDELLRLNDKKEILAGC